MLIKCKLENLLSDEETELLEINFHPDFYKGQNQQVLVTSKQDQQIRSIKIIADGAGQQVKLGLGTPT